MMPSGSTDASAPLPSTSSSTPEHASAVAAAQRGVSGAAPTLVGAASGPSAWAVPVVPKQTAARRTSTLAMCGIVPQCTRSVKQVAVDNVNGGLGGGGGAG